MLSEAGAGGGEVCRRPGPRRWGTLGFPEAQLLTAITAYRAGGGWVAVGSGIGDTLWPALHGSVQRPLAPLKRSQEEGASPGPRAWPCGSQTAQVCVPRVRYPLTLACVLGVVSTWLCTWWEHCRGNLGPSICRESRCFFLIWTVLVSL